MGEWHEVEKDAIESPCEGCHVAFASWEWKEKNGKKYTRSTSCHETCREFKDYIKKLGEDWCEERKST